MRSTRRWRVLAFALPAVLVAVGGSTSSAAADSPDFFISSPADGGTLTGTQASISLAGTFCAGVSWQVDGQAPASVMMPSYFSEGPGDYTFDSRVYANGPHTFTARTGAACDGSPAVDYLSSRTFSVSNIAPVVTVTSPAVQATVSGRAVTLSAGATSDPNGRQHIAQVEFLVDGVRRGVDTLAPFSLSLDSRVLTNGPHTVSTVATDSAGLVGQSATQSFQVANYHSNVTVDTDKERTVAGTAVTVTGTAGSVEDGSPISGKSVSLFVRRADQSGWAKVATPISRSDGSLMAKHKPLFSSFYRWQYAGDASHSAATSGAVKVNVVPVVRLGMLANTVRRGVTLKGAVRITPANGGQRITFQQRRLRGAWTTVLSGVTSPTLTALRVKFPRAGVYELRVTRQANTVGAAASSNVVRIRVS